MFKKTLITMFFSLFFFSTLAIPAEIKTFKNNITNDLMRIIDSEKYTKVSDQTTSNIKEKMTKYFDILRTMDVVSSYHIEIGHVDDILGIEVLYHFVTDERLTEFSYEERNS